MKNVLANSCIKVAQIRKTVTCVNKMELPAEGIFCVAKGCSKNNVVSASIQFPYTLNLSKNKAELAVKYIAVTPAWNIKQNLFLILTDNETSEETTIKFEPMTDLHRERVILAIRQQIAAVCSKSPPALLRLVNAPGNKSQVLKLVDDATVTVSPDLAELLGVEEFYENSTGFDMVIPIRYQKTKQTTTTDIYYLKSEEIAGNFFLDNQQDRIIELLHISGFQTVDFYPRLTYSRVEASLLDKLTFTLYKENHIPVSSLHTDLYIVCHLRPKHGN